MKDEMAVRAEQAERWLGVGSVMTPAWRVYALCLLGVVAFWPAFAGLLGLWRDTADYNHGYLIAGVSILWLARLRPNINALQARTTLAAVPLVLVAAALFLVAHTASSQIVQQLVAPLAILLAVFAAAGRDVARSVAGPVAYLYLAIPIWDELLPLLQGMTTDVAETVLRLLQVPATVESHVVTIPEGRFTIIEGCSGKRYLLVAMAFAGAVAAMQRLRIPRAALLMGSAVVLALIANWLRVIIIIYAGHVSNMENYLVAREHISFGWFMFVPLLLAVLLIARRLEQRQPSANELSSPARAAPGTAWLLPAACLCLPMLIVAIRPQAPNVPRLARMPIMVDGWQGPLPAAQSWRPHFVAPADEQQVAYGSGSGDVQLYVNVYGQQSGGHELIFFANSVVPRDWTILQALPERDGMTTVLARDLADRRWVVAKIYLVGGRQTSIPALAQLYYGALSLWRPVPSGTVALAAACSADCTDALGRIHALWHERGPAIVQLIPTTFAVPPV